MTSLAAAFGTLGPAAGVASSSDHRGARDVLEQAWRYVTGRAPRRQEIQAVQAIAAHETGYGRLPPFPGSHNFGAVQTPGTWGASSCPEGSMLASDTIPSRDGTSRRAPVCFRAYPDDVAGAVDLVRQLTTARPRTRRALATGDADLIAGAMYVERYFAGHGATDAERVAHYAKAIAARAHQVAAGLSEPLMVRRHVHDAGGGVLPLAALLGLGVALPHAVAAGELEDLEQAGLNLFTFVTPDDAKRYVREVDAGWDRTDQDIAAAADKIATPVKGSWAIDLEAWRRFRDDATATVGWLNAKATMEQCDRWASKLVAWRKALSDQGASITGPGIVAPTQGAPESTASAGWIQLALFVAALFGVGYLVRGFRALP